jgi:hypothetical protein
MSCYKSKNYHETSKEIFYARFSSGFFPGVWILKAGVSEHSVGSIIHTTYLRRWNRQCSESRLLIFRRRGNTQKKIYLIYNTAKVRKLWKKYFVALWIILPLLHTCYILHRPMYLNTYHIQNLWRTRSFSRMPYSYKKIIGFCKARQ